MPLQVPFPAPRCTPSPSIPGAWPYPSTPLERRKSLSYTSTQEVVTSPTPLHLDRVINFHKRFSLSFTPADDPKLASTPTEDHRSHAVASHNDGLATVRNCLDQGTMPSEESDLTRYTMHATSASEYFFQDASYSTAYTVNSTQAVAESVKLTPPRERSGQSPEEGRIYSLAESNRPPTPTSPTLRSSRVQHDDSLSTSSSHSISSPPRLTVQSSPISADTSLSSPVSGDSAAPSSSIIFASPTSSEHAYPSTASTDEQEYLSSLVVDDLYEGSPSWETSYGSYNVADMLQSTSPSTSDQNREPQPGRLRPANFQEVEDAESEVHTPSIIIRYPEAMITTLSLPGSIPSIPSIDTNRNSPSAQDSPVILELAVSPSLSFGDLSPQPSAMSSSGQRPRFRTGKAQVVQLPASSPPSPSISGSDQPSSFGDQALRSLPVPLNETNAMGLEMDSSAAEYAAAIMSSAWESDYEEPLDIVPNRLAENFSIHEEDSASQRGIAVVENDRVSTPNPGLGTYNHQITEVVHGPANIFWKAKLFGGRIRRFLKGKKKKQDDDKENTGVNIDVDVDVRGGRTAFDESQASAHPTVGVELPGARGSFTPGRDHEDAADSSNQIRLPVLNHHPSRLIQESRKSRPVLTTQTYDDNVNLESQHADPHPPLIRIHPPPLFHSRLRSHVHSRSHLTAKINIRLGRGPSGNINNTAPVIPVLSPSRRFSLSAISSYGRSASPLESAIPPAMSTPPSRRPMEQRTLDEEIPPGAFVVTQHEFNVPPGLSPPSRPLGLSSTVPNENITSPLPAAQSPTANRKANRRFSLSALSNLTVGRAASMTTDGAAPNDKSWARRSLRM